MSCSMAPSSTVCRYDVTCSICSSTIKCGDRMFCFNAFLPLENPLSSSESDSCHQTLLWGHEVCYDPSLPSPPSCRHWQRLGRCPALEVGMCAFQHKAIEKGSCISLDKSRWGGKRHYVRNQHKNTVFRIFLMQTYGMEYLTQENTTILDVGGGKGELSWELLNLTGVPECVVIDPRPLNLKLAQKKWAKGMFEPKRTGPVFSKWYPKCEEGSKSRTSMSPSHIRCFFDSNAFIEFIEVDEENIHATNHWFNKEIVNAMRTVWTEKGLQHEYGMQCKDDIIHDLRGSESADKNSMILAATDIMDPIKARNLLKRCHLIVGLHPDQAVGDIVDFALARNIPWCVVPCCVYSNLFTTRKLNDGSTVKSYEQLVKWLCEKDPLAEIATLELEGKHTVVYSIPKKCTSDSF